MSAEPVAKKLKGWYISAFADEQEVEEGSKGWGRETYMVVRLAKVNRVFFKIGY